LIFRAQVPQTGTKRIHGKPRRSLQICDAPNDRNGHFKLVAEELHSRLSRTEAAPDGNTITLSTFLYKGFRNSFASTPMKREDRLGFLEG
jgi:hypothetical protein